jgi:hypothetical protein
MEEQRKKWCELFGPGPYTVHHTSLLRPDELLVYVKEFYEDRDVWDNKQKKMVVERHWAVKGLIESWFKVVEAPVTLRKPKATPRDKKGGGPRS